MKLKDLKKELNKIEGIDDWDVHILLEELPNQLRTIDCTRLGICIDDHVVILGFVECPHCKGEE